MKTLWVHLGAPKTGSTSIQRFCREQDDFLSDHGVRLIRIGRHGALNALAIALKNRRTDQIARITQEIEQAIDTAQEPNLIMSSEMLNRVRPQDFRAALPSVNQNPVRFVYYIKRQDEYLEAIYKQKLKTGRVVEGLDSYIETFASPGRSFKHIIDAWSEEFPEADWHIRRIQPGTLVNDDVVDDFLSLFGVTEIPDPLRGQGKANVSPDLDTLEVMRQLRLAGPGQVNLRRMNREVSRSDARMSGPRGRMLTTQQARRVLEMFEDDNEAIRQRFFPDEPQLFNEDGMDALEPVRTSFTDDQLELLQGVFQAFFATHSYAGR